MMDLVKLNKSILEIKRARRRVEFSLDYVFTGRLGKKQRKSRRKSFEHGHEWKAVRLQAIKLFGQVCLRCGSTDNINVDHIKPKSKYPELALDINNLQTLCWPCNKSKSNKQQIDYRSPQIKLIF